MKKYLKGSTWKKWDLHIHSKYSLENNTKMEITTIFENAIKNNIAVISITDHTNVDGLDEIIKIYNTHTFDSDGKVIKVKDSIEYLPGIELKTDAGGKGTHIIGIFPKEINGTTVDKYFLEQNLLSPLDVTSYNIRQNGNGEYSKGLLCTTVNFKSACERIKKLNGVVIIHSGDKHGSIEKCIAHAKKQTPQEVYNSLGELKKSYMETYIDICEVSSFKDAEANSKFYLNTFKKPTIISSDSHENYIGKKFTWIKAEPNLNGLKQILNEPFTRVAIDKPEEKLPYNVIDKVRFICENNNFSNEWIELNDNLNTIIGGKSSGKSLLLYLIAKTNLGANILDKNINYDLKKLGIEDFEVCWKDGTKTSLQTDNQIRNLTYLPQLYLNNIVEKNKEELEKVIHNIILEKNDLKKFYDDFEKDKEKLEKELKLCIESLLENINAQIELNNSLLDFPEKKAIDEEIKKLEKEIRNLEIQSQLTVLEKNNYDILKEDIDNIEKDLVNQEQDKKTYKELINKLKIYENNILKIYDEMKIEVNNINKNDSIKQILDDEITSIIKNTNDKHLSLINIISNLKEKIQTSINNNNTNLEIKKSEIKPLQTKISDYDSIAKLKENINKEKTKLKNIIDIEKKLIIADNDIKKLKQNIKKIIIDLKQKYNEMKIKFMENKEISKNNKLELEINIIFDSESFKERFNSKLDLRKSLEKLFIDCFSNDDFIYDYNLLEETLMIICENILNNSDIKMKKGCTKFDLIQELFKNYLKFSYDLKQNQDNLLSMSPGKRGLIIFQLYLQLSSSEFPILVDQPEDNLDNRTVYNELKDFIIEKKKKRQIIMVTHNANLVVATDAEEVIVANQSGEIGNNDNDKYRFEYISGALENTFVDLEKKGILKKKGIKEHVCEILEGGEEAFENRNKKYNIIKS